MCYMEEVMPQGGAENHFSSLCRGTASSNCIMEDNASHDQDESISFITTVNTQPLLWQDRGEGITHGNLTYNQFAPEKPEPSPFINLKVTLNAKLGQSIKMDLEPRTVLVTAVADTGAQTTTAGEDILMKLGCNHNSLLRSKHSLRAINNYSLPIKGALIVTISLGGETCLETIYICPKVKRLYISQASFKKLRLIFKIFPEEPRSEIVTAMNDQKVSDDMLAPCGCPTRFSCLPVPDTLTLLTTPEYHEELENLIKCYFANSRFNTCTHQKLQTMTGEPLFISFLPTCSHT